ncbi:hypothetical protein ADUPG1_006028 [Aduncisulcus paluster]|uniref:Uncharacterized protein n=1 Tax=Aduncisulcus paluster TaxID=2918883 RepID=A0ABQ5KGK7_9EUKA|nr:hypothetical protein ADUPG1_006028 [Aduncisulcus paluster]
MLRGSKKKLTGVIPMNLISILHNFSNSSQFTGHDSLLALIKSYIVDWWRVYQRGFCFGTLAKIISVENPKDKFLFCDKSWPIFYPLINTCREFVVGCKIIEDDNYNLLWLISNLCYDHRHTLEAYKKVKDLLEGWFDAIKKAKSIMGINFFSKLLSIFSTIPSLALELSPKFDDPMMWCYDMAYFTVCSDCENYFENIFKIVSATISSSCLLRSVPMSLIIPSIETSDAPDADGYTIASHICGMEFFKMEPMFQNWSSVSSLYNVISGSEIRCNIFIRGDCCCEQILPKEKKETELCLQRIVHSSLIQYSLPQHFIIAMSFEEERSLRQSTYDFIEQSGGGVELLFHIT